MAVRFQVSTNRTGIHRVLRVVLHDDLEALRIEEARLSGDDIDPSTAAFYWPADTWEDRDPRPSVGGTLHLARDQVDATLIAHEAVHVAMTIYSIDGYRDHARASAHLNGHNEAVAYMVGDLVSAIGLKLMHLGVDLQIGRGRHYQSPLYPHTIPRDAPL